MSRAKESSRLAVGDAVLKEFSDRILRRDRFTCQVCGAVREDSSSLRPRRRGRLTLGYITRGPKGSRDLLGNLRTECTDCNDGLKNVALPARNRIELFKQIRRATLDDQRAVLNWLEQKFRSRDQADDETST